MKKAVAFFTLAGLLFCTSCFALPVEEPVLPPPVIRGAETTSYKTMPVSRGDVTYYRDLNASFVSAREEALSFTISDIYIKAVYVEVGDTVQKGDIVAELERDYILKDLERAQQEETWALLSLKQLEERHALDLAEADVTGVLADEYGYQNERDALLTQLEGIRIRMAHLRVEDESRVLRAGMDGTVTYVLSIKEGDVSQADQRVVRLADQTESVFMVRGNDTQFLTVGGRYELIVNWESFTAEVVDPETLGISRVNSDETYLVIVSEEQPQASSRTYATLHLVLNEVKDTLYVSYQSVKKANARVFVYVLVDGVRTIRDIEIGLEGNMLTEVKSGLAEGEMVIIE